MKVEVYYSIWTAVVVYDMYSDAPRATLVKSFEKYDDAVHFINKAAIRFAKEFNVPMHWHDWSDDEKTQYQPYQIKKDFVDANNDALLVETDSEDRLWARIETQVL